MKWEKVQKKLNIRFGQGTSNKLVTGKKKDIYLLANPMERTYEQ